jgi:hypothetical protein
VAFEHSTEESRVMSAWTFTNLILCAFVAEICLWLSSEFLRRLTGADQPLPVDAAGAVGRLLACVALACLVARIAGRVYTAVMARRAVRPAPPLIIVGSPSEKRRVATTRRAA